MTRLGVVSFDAGKVRRVARFRKWTQDDDSVELAQRLCDLLETLRRERGAPAQHYGAGERVTVRGVEMVFGDKRVSFNIAASTCEGVKLRYVTREALS